VVFVPASACLPDDADWLQQKLSHFLLRRERGVFVVGLFRVHLGLNHLAIVLDAI
jgi:hypothetical protein